MSFDQIMGNVLGIEIFLLLRVYLSINILWYCATLDLAYNFEIETSCMFVHFVLILESSCSFRLKCHQLVLGVIVAITFNTVGFIGDNCQVSPVRSLKALIGSQSLPFLMIAILLVTRQHNSWPHCWESG